MTVKIVLSALLSDLRRIIDEREQIARKDAELSRQKTEIEIALMRYAQEQGIEQFGNEQIAITVSEEMRAKYDPAKWPDIMRWAVETGNEHLIQRRLSDAKIIDAASSGVALPDGLALEPYTKLSAKRKNT